jgi:uncharacterized cysteine cluster protein YcgN (CxxCxxCC family)
MTEPFWRTKSLAQMSRSEWESLCDGCARCCLVKLEDEDTSRIYYTDIGCRLLDQKTCRCTDYAHRSARVRDCLRLTPRRAHTWGWLPPTCAYRLLAEGRELYWWHPLVSGDPDTVHQAGVSVRGRLAGSEGEIKRPAFEDHIVNWPLAVPPSAKKPPSRRKRLKSRPKTTRQKS